MVKADVAPIARSPRGARRQELILDAALNLFARSGYGAVSLREIAEASGIRHPTLLSHFASKEDILQRILRRADVEAESDIQVGVPSAPSVVGEELRRARDSNWRSLLVQLVGEATATQHPAHAWVQDRYARLRSRIRASLGEELGQEAANRSAQIVAMLDGLRILERYLPDEIDLDSMVSRYGVLLYGGEKFEAGLLPKPGVRPSMVPSKAFIRRMSESVEGYAVGRRRRSVIVDIATRLFAVGGYAGTSLRDIALEADVSTATLRHHYPTKDKLLTAVLVARDAAVTIPLSEAAPAPAVDLLEATVRNARENLADSPGLIEVYSVLGSEAVIEDHPAHGYFVTRFLGLIESIEEMLIRAAHDGDLPAYRSPRDEAIWLIALWDGLQLQWLYDRDSIDIAELLASHLDDLLPHRHD